MEGLCFIRLLEPFHAFVSANHHNPRLPILVEANEKMRNSSVVMVGLGIAVSLVLTAGVVYGVMGRPSFPAGVSMGLTGNANTYGGGMMGGSTYGAGAGMMGGYGSGMMGSGASYFGGMMGSHGGMMSQFPRYMWNQTGGGDFVAIANYGFYPQTLTVSKGTTVTWVNMDLVQHTVTAGSEQAPTNLFDSHELNHMQSFSYTFNTPGTYSYYCDVHPDMAGTIVVTG